MGLQDFLSEKAGKRILLLTHQNADIDAVASLLILGYYLKKLGFKNFDYSVADGISLQARTLLKYSDKEFVEPVPKDYDMVATVDVSDPRYLPKVDLEGVELVVIDHHQLSEYFASDNCKAACFVDPDSVSMTEYLYNSFDIPIDKTIARLVLAGIIFDSGYLRLASRKTFQTIAKLLDEFGLEYPDILAELSTEMSVSEKIARIKGAKRAKVVQDGGAIIATARVGSYESSVARGLVGLGADVAFVASDSDGARISGRAHAKYIKEHSLNLGKNVMPKVGRLLGGSGSGHAAAAGANGPNKEKIGEALKLCTKLVVENNTKKQLGEKGEENKNGK